ncbi:MAG: AAA family ATPase [Candidatus Omnitrophota bacterium]
MKLAISGKGGVGKTTLAAALAIVFAKDKKKVFAIDCDPDANLASAMGYEGKITPIIEMKKLISERTGAKPQALNSYFKLNPKIDDIPDKFAVRHRDIKILSMGTIKKAGGGCLCPENTFLRNLLAHLIVNRDEVVIMDMVAGCEHLGRATASCVDAMIIVVQPDERSIETAKKIKDLAAGLGIKKVLLVANKIRAKGDKKFIDEKTRDFNKIGVMNFDDDLLKARGLIKEGTKLFDEVKRVRRNLSIQYEKTSCRHSPLHRVSLL